MAGLRIAFGLAACALGCVTTAAAPDPMESTGAETGTTTGTGTTTFDPPLACAGSDECAPGFCVAPYDAAAGRGDAVCVDACVPELALDRWCIDDAACCDGLECGSVDGLCVLPYESADSSVGETWVTLGTTDDTTTGTTTDGTTTGDTGDSSSGSSTDDTSSSTTE